MAEERKATLYLFPVPMGNTPPADVLPARNIALVRGIRHFIVENVRSARRFLKACSRDIDIDTLTFAELNEHTLAADVPAMLQPLREGFDMGVISEAGCPAVADPGADAVACALRQGFRVEPLVGPSSIILSVMASGFNGQSFAFNGYLPIDSEKRLARLRELERRIRRERQTQVFIETPYRNNRLVEWLCSHLADDILLCVASDLTGPRENVTTLSIRDWKRHKYDYDKIPSIFLLYS